MNTSVQTILDALEVNELPAAEQEEILGDLNDLVFKGTLIRLLERMDTPAREAFEELLSKDAPEEVLKAFIQQNAPDAHNAVSETLSELTSDILLATQK